VANAAVESALPLAWVEFVCIRELNHEASADH
jgi:hypothetical protein